MSQKVGFVEGDRVEFKESWNDGALKNLASFANTHGGDLYVGVTDTGLAVGTDVSDDAQQRIASQVISGLRIVPELRVQDIAGVDVLVVSVQRSAQPVRLRGSYYVRAGTVTTELPAEQWAAQVVKQAGRSWDEMPSDLPAESIDVSRVHAFIRQAQSQPKPTIPNEIDDSTPVHSLLTSLGLVAGDRLTNAGVLLFGLDPQRLFRNARVRIVLVRSNDEFEPFDDEIGSVLEQIENAIRRVSLYNTVRYTFDDPPAGQASLTRQERPKYAPFAIREAIVNAVVHRDYTVPGDVEVRIYENSIEVWNPGGLPASLTIDSLRRPGHPSVRRNPLVAEVARMAGYFDSWGTGTTRMIARSRELGVPEPLFEQDSGGFRVTLHADVVTEESLRALGLMEREVQAMLWIRRTGSVTRRRYKEQFGIPERTAARDLDELQRRGLLDRHGTTGRGVFYTVATSKPRRS